MMDSSYEPPSRPMGSQEIVQAVRRFWWLILVCTVIGGLAVAGLTQWLQPESYQSNAVLLVNQDSASDLILDLPQRDILPERAIENEATFAESRSVKERAEQELGFGAAIMATPSESADVLELSAQAETAERAQLVVMAYTDAYIELRVEADSAVYDQTVQAVETQIDALRSDLDATTNAATRDRLLSRIEDYERSVNDLRVSADGATGGVAVLAAADLPEEPVSPQAVRNGLIGAILGLALGTTLAVVRFSTDDRVRSAAGVESALPGVRVLGEVERLDDPSSNGSIARTVWDSSSGEGDAASYRYLASAIRSRISEGETRLVMITDLDGVGTGDLVAQLAVANSRSGQHTIAIDADLRAPSLHHCFDIPEKPGIISLTTGQSTAWEAFREIGLEPNLRVLPADVDETFDPDLLFGKEASHFFRTIDLLDKDFLALVAGPGLEDGGLALSTLLDAVVVIVVQEGISRVTEIRDALRRLERADVGVLGLVLDI